jgi:hypothetical protein
MDACERRAGRKSLFEIRACSERLERRAKEGFPFFLSLSFFCLRRRHAPASSPLQSRPLPLDDPIDPTPHQQTLHNACILSAPVLDEDGE